MYQDKKNRRRESEWRKNTERKEGEESCKADGLGRRRRRGRRKKIVRRFSSIGPVLSAVLMAAEPLPWAAGVPEISIWTRNILNSGTTRGREVSCTPIPSRGNDKTSFFPFSSYFSSLSLVLHSWPVRINISSPAKPPLFQPSTLEWTNVNGAL